MSYSVPHYLDASVMVALICKEPASEVIDAYIRKHWSFHFYATEFAFYEVLGVLKRKWLKKELTNDKYFSAVSVYSAYLDEGLIKIDRDFRPDDRSILLPLKDIVDRNAIDYSDALQIYAVRNGKQKGHIGPCHTVLVTADCDLAEAAEKEGLRIWHFPNGIPPEAEEA